MLDLPNEPSNSMAPRSNASWARFLIARVSSFPRLLASLVRWPFVGGDAGAAASALVAVAEAIGTSAPSGAPRPSTDQGCSDRSALARSKAASSRGSLFILICNAKASQSVVFDEVLPCLAFVHACVVARSSFCNGSNSLKSRPL